MSEDRMINTLKADAAVFIADMIDQWMEEETSRCESPIEKAFLAALMTRLLLYGESFELLPTTEDAIRRAKSSELRFFIVPQALVGEYRLDFLIVVRIARVTIRTVIECDGHEFHEKTKDQASRDKKRDRTLTMTGYRIGRFSGSDIYRNAFECAS